ncbi:hypothetical protein CCY01nite_51430 [Chitinophaga cymbidii]|uniref:DUF5013 domain-containing protein n=2 Tax=Chitinophaga cymbidii TaxID=1096750 RepID=A0A512RT59_9BACT|nr:hypothetical protein CCY01nite_51430 [Chitinophaga cymbidii]
MLASACRKMDDFRKEYLGNGAITYAGKIDSVKIHPGNGRLMISGLLIGDPKIVKLKIYWDNKTDSLIVPVNRSAGVDTMRIMLNDFPESVKTFMLITEDKYGNTSMAVNITGRIYGPQYNSTLLNRTVELAEMKGDSVVVDWNTLDASSGGISTEVEFTDLDGNTQKVVTERKDSVAILHKFKPGTTFKYRTKFLPDTLAIDTFYSDYRNVGVRADITAQYIKNSGQPFTAASGTDRWRIPADWTVSDDVKNAGGLGGIDAGDWLPSPALSMEGGWGLPAVPNGKIHQTVTLPAGNYSFEVLMGDCSDGGTKYITIAEGNELPDVDPVPEEALAFSGMVRNTTNVVKFTLTAQTTVSLGFNGKLPDTGTFMKIYKVRLFTLP